MRASPYHYVTRGNVHVVRTSIAVPIESAMEEISQKIDSYRGAIYASSYEYPGRYKRWSVGFINPPIEITSNGSSFSIIAHNDRGELLLPFLEETLCNSNHIQDVVRANCALTGQLALTNESFSEEFRSKQPSIFSVIREILKVFYSSEDEHLGLYGAFGYDLIFQFETIDKFQQRPDDQRDLVLYLPDSLVIIDSYLKSAISIEYEFRTPYGCTEGLPRSGATIDFRGICQDERDLSGNVVPGRYANLVCKAIEYFKRGDLFEVVPSQKLIQECHESPLKLFKTLQAINPSPYGFMLNLGGEYLVGASPEMFVRVEGNRVETCPISGTIKRGESALEDSERIRQLLNSSKDEAELTMCTDVDRNDKSRICVPGSVEVIGRRQIELYSHLIHTVDHVEGFLRPTFDALDAFLTHVWAVTVTGAPKRAAVKFIEENEDSIRRWYGGATGWLAFNGNLNTGLVLRTIRLKDSIAEVRVGATLLYDSIPADEEQETLTKAAALLETIHSTRNSAKAGLKEPKLATRNLSSRKVLIVDHEDSFVHTLANYIRQTGADVTTLRHDFCQEEINFESLDLIVLSPGPGTPSDFKVSELVKKCVALSIPIFGVCLGFQGIIEAYGGQLGTLSCPQHGKPSLISVVDTDSRLFRGLPKSFKVGRYHSLFALPDKIPNELKVTSVSEDGVIMSIEHKELPIVAVQFHPESIMSLTGKVGLKMIQNVVLNYI